MGKAAPSIADTVKNLRAGRAGPFQVREFIQPWLDLNDKSVLVTGGTGSFGRQFVKTVVERYSPRRLIVFSRDERKQMDMAEAFPKEKYPFLRYFIGDIRDRDRLELALRDVDYVVHAAALKQVDIAEYNPFECVRTNILGAENVVCAALQRGVRKVIALSSEKTASPVNLYGASKLASDKIFVAGNNLRGSDGTRFSVVRYGSVLGEGGDVARQFRKLIIAGGDSLPIADERMTRFWITPAQGVDFLLSSMELMTGGEIFVPKLPSSTITDLATSMGPHMKQRIVGVPPGEKLNETMISEDDSPWTVELDDRYVILASYGANLRESYIHRGAKPVSEDFRYTSACNTEMLSVRGLQALVEEAFDGLIPGLPPPDVAPSEGNAGSSRVGSRTASE